MTLKDAYKELQNGKSLRMVAAEMGINHTTLSRKLKEAGYSTPTKSESAKNTWKNHKHPNLGKKGELSHQYGKKMSPATREKMQAIYDRIAEERRYGIKKNSDGYVLVYSPNHPHCDKGGYVLEHRLVYENFIGRVLNSNEIIHHINGIKDDNRVENLALTNRSEHFKLHNKEKLNA